jgi:hypothetical protein
VATFSASDDAISLIRDTDDDDDDDVYVCIKSAFFFTAARKKKMERDLKTPKEKKESARARFTCDSTSSPPLNNRTLHPSTDLFSSSSINIDTINNNNS